MRTFRDITGREWQLRITVWDVQRVREELKIDLMDMNTGETPLVSRLHVDMILLIGVIWVCVEDQAKKFEVTPEQFGRSLGGTEVQGATKAFWDELRDFFRQQGREEVAVVIEKGQELAEAVVKEATSRVAAVDPVEELRKRLPPVGN